MNINDLETCEFVEFDNQIIGGKPYTFLQGGVKAKRGDAYAYIATIAKGDSTSTGAKSGVSESPYYAAGYYAGYSVAIDGRKVSYKTGYGSDYAK